jgi:hypothetical protein
MWLRGTAAVAASELRFKSVRSWCRDFAVVTYNYRTRKKSAQRFVQPGGANMQLPDQLEAKVTFAIDILR